MPGGFDSYVATVLADGPVGYYMFNELLTGQAVTAGGQNPQSICFDSSIAGNRNVVPFPNANFMEYGSAVLSNQPSLRTTRGTSNQNGSALFPTTSSASATNIISAGAAVAASGTYTITGTPTTSDNNSYVINGVTVTAPQTTGNTVTQQAAADVLVINSTASVDALVVASSAAGVVTITAKVAGPSGNAITTTGSSSGGDTLTANQATLSGGSGIASAVQPTILQPTSAVTVEAWCQPSVCSTGSVLQVLACYGSNASSLAAYNLYHSGSSATNHVFASAVNIAGTLKTATASAPPLVVGTTYHVVGVYNGVDVFIYVNGVLEGTTAATGAISYASIGSYGLACGNDPSLTNANLQGYLDDLAIYSSALSATRIAYHYRQGSTLLPFVWRH